MIVNVILILLIVFWGYNKNLSVPNIRKRFVVRSGVLMAIYSGFRHQYYGTGDTDRYCQAYLETASESFEQIAMNHAKDPFFSIFNKCLSFVFGTEAQFMLIFYAIFVVGAVSYVVYKESKDPMLSFVLFISLGFLSFMMNGLRQSIAMGFIMLSYPFLKEKKLIKFVAAVLLGSLFHNTSIVFLLAYPAYIVGFKRNVILLYAVIVTICMTMGQSILNVFLTEAVVYDSARFEGYLTYSSSNNLSGFVQYLLFFALAIQVYKKYVNSEPNAQLLYALLALALVFQSMTTVQGEFFRVAMYFGMYVILLVPNALTYFPPAKQQSYRKWLIFLLLVYFLFLGWGNNPYAFFWQDYQWQSIYNR